MANKFIVFVVLAAVAQATLASSTEGSSALKTAEEGTRASWQAGGDTVCKSVLDASWPIKDAEDQYSSQQAEGGEFFLRVAPLSGNQTLQAEITSLFTILSNAIFKGIYDARKCSDFATIKAKLENDKNQLPYELIVEDFHKTTEDTGSWTPAVDALKDVYETFYCEIEKVAQSVCGGGKTVDTCALEEIHKEIDVLVKELYSWLYKNE